ncbi:MAG: hypothetical protein JOZ51_28185, partial [Chloroflexi bacterium]|nr:hypothetical protein [Chloroflexota bacterium]
MTYRWISIVLGSLLLLTGFRPLQTTDAASIKLTVQPFFEGNYRAGNWIPFRITVANEGQDLSATVTLQAGTSFAANLELPRGAEKSLILYARPLDEIRRVATVRVLTSGAELAKVETPIKGVNAAAPVVGYISQQAVTLPQPAAPPATPKIAHLPIQPGELPDRSEALSMFDALVIDGAPLTGLTATQQQALTDWVRLGGQLVIGGTDLQATLAQLPENLRAATVGGAAPGGQISLLPELTAEQTPAAIEVRGAAGTRSIATAGATTVGVQQQFGQGQISVLGFSLSAPELGLLPDAALVWENVATLHVSTTDLQQMQQTDDVQAQQFASVLTLLPVLAVPPMTTLAIVLGLYLLIIGPGLYLLLRRLDCQAWGWVAVPLVTIVFSLGAYGYGLRLRGSDTILNQISIVESIAGRSRVRTYAGIFSPRTQTYQIKTSPEALIEPIVGGDFGGGAPLSPGQYLQDSGSIKDLGVPQWSMRMFAAEQMLDVQPIEAKMTIDRATLRGTVRNTSTEPIANAALVHGTQIVNIGTLPPGESREVELALDGGAAFDRNTGIGNVLLGEKNNSFNRAGQLPIDVRMQQTMVDTIFNPLFEPPAAPVVVGWINSGPLPVALEPMRAQHQQLTLIVATAEITLSENGSFALTQSWFDPTFEASGSNVGGPCITRFSDGWYIDVGTLTSTMRLPADIEASDVSQATLRVERDGAPTVLKLSAYDWQSGQWVEQQLER